MIDWTLLACAVYILAGPQIIAKGAVTKMSARGVTIHDRQPRAARPYFEQGAETKTILSRIKG